MKPLILSLFAALTAFAAFADDAPAAAKPLDPKIERLVRDSVIRCKEMTLAQEPSPMNIPGSYNSMLITIKSPRSLCEGQFIGVTSRNGGFYLGIPWVIKDVEGKTIEDRIKNFAWQNMHETFSPEIRHEVTVDGLYPVTLWQTTERGKMPMGGEVDINGGVFFLGKFQRMSDDLNAVRLKSFEPVIGKAPQEGAAKAKGTL